jgi:hypothetical protein
MGLLVGVSSFHTRNDNDFARANGSTTDLRIHLPAAPDGCPACRLEGLFASRPKAVSLLILLAGVPALQILAPATPHVEPRVKIESRPPPSH